MLGKRFISSTYINRSHLVALNSLFEIIAKVHDALQGKRN